jgi:hypothetical protein
VPSTISKIDSEKQLSTIRGNTLAEVFENFAKDVEASKVAEKAWFEKNGPESYVFHFEDALSQRTRIIR